MIRSKKIRQSLFSLFKIKLFNLPVTLLYNILKPVAPAKLLRFFYKFPYNGKVKIKITGSKPFVMVSNGSDIIANEIYWKGIMAYEPQTENIILKLLQSAEVFFDIGANTGLYSLIAASRNHKIQVHSFEPVDSAYNLFTASIKASGLTNIKPNKIAVSNLDGESTFNLQMTSSTIPLGSSLRQDMGDQENKLVIKVKTMMLDTYVEQNNVNKIDLMKIDTEGTEDKVLEGGEQALNKFRPVFICEVLSNTNLEEKLHALMDRRNYNYYFINDNSLEQVEKIVGDPYVVSNYLFIPEEKIELVLNNIRITKIRQKVFN
ncbi:MAG TPA: FkbM family methyltransferase [Ignavibacteria bacterium]